MVAVVVETHWLSGMVMGRQMPRLDVSELLVEGKQILMMPFSLAVDLEMVCGGDQCDVQK